MNRTPQLHSLGNRMLSFLIVLGIITVTLSASLLSFAKKIVTYDTESAIRLSVKKKVYKVASPVAGNVTSTKAIPGQHVSKGDTLLITVSPQLDSQRTAGGVFSPTDGIVASIAQEGEGLNYQSEAALVYADSDIQLLGLFNIKDYAAVQSNLSELKAVDQRLDETYPISFKGIRQEVDSDGPNKGLTGVYFSFNEPEKVINLLQNEQLLLQYDDNRNKDPKPIQRLVSFYRKFFTAGQP